MKITKLLLIISMILLLSVICIVLRSYTKRNIRVTSNQLGFPYALKDEVRTDKVGGELWTARVFVPRNHYSKENLDRLFLFFSASHPNKEERMTVMVYTEVNKLTERELEGEPPKNSVRENGLSAPYSALYDAIFFRRGEGAMTGAGENAWYIYRPDLNESGKTTTVVLRGKDPSAQKDVLAVFESTDKSVKYRIISYELENVEPRGIYHTLQGPEGSGLWRSVMTIQENDRATIPSDNFAVLSNQVAYGFLGWKYAVTLDKGNTWLVWDAETELPNWKCCNPKLIESVKVSSDGTGTLTLDQISAGRRELYTKDFGKHWQFDN